MRNWKSILGVLVLLAAVSAASQKALSRFPVDLLLLRVEGKEVEAYRIGLYLNGRETAVESLRLDASQKKSVVSAVDRRDKRPLILLARETGGCRFVAAQKGGGNNWPWYLGGPKEAEDTVSNIGRGVKRYLSLVSGPIPSPAYEVTAPAPESGKGAGLELHPEDWIETHPLGQASPTPAILPAVKVEILNDCGIKGAADGIARALKRPGIDIFFVGNTPRYRYRSTRVQSSVGVPVVLQEILEQMGFSESSVEKVPAGRRKADVTVIVGRDYRKVLERMNARSAD